MYTISSINVYDAETMSTDMFKYDYDSNQYHSRVNSRESRYRIRGCIKLSQAEWKRMLLSTRNMDKSLHILFKAVVNDIQQALPFLGENGSKVSYFVPEPRYFAEVTRLSENMNKPTLKETQKDIKNLINNQTFLIQEPEKGDPVTPCMDVYKAKIQSDGILDKLKFKSVVRGDMQNQ